MVSDEKLLEEHFPPDTEGIKIAAHTMDFQSKHIPFHATILGAKKVLQTKGEPAENWERPKSYVPHEFVFQSSADSQYSGPIPRRPMTARAETTTGGRLDSARARARPLTASHNRGTAASAVPQVAPKITPRRLEELSRPNPRTQNPVVQRRQNSAGRGEKASDAFSPHVTGDIYREMIADDRASAEFLQRMTELCQTAMARNSSQGLQLKFRKDAEYREAQGQTSRLLEQARQRKLDLEREQVLLQQQLHQLRDRSPSCVH